MSLLEYFAIFGLVVLANGWCDVMKLLGVVLHERRARKKAEKEMKLQLTVSALRQEVMQDAARQQAERGQSINWHSDITRTANDPNL